MPLILKSCQFTFMIFLERDGVCYPVTHVLPTVPMLNHVETLRTGQYAPSGVASSLDSTAFIEATC
jgi:hypothetical protein